MPKQSLAVNPVLSAVDFSHHGDQNTRGAAISIPFRRGIWVQRISCRCCSPVIRLVDGGLIDQAAGAKGNCMPLCHQVLG